MSAKTREILQSARKPKEKTAAYALAAIARHNSKVRKELEPKMKGMVGTEKNNGVKKVCRKELDNINDGKH